MLIKRRFVQFSNACSLILETEFDGMKTWSRFLQPSNEFGPISMSVSGNEKNFVGEFGGMMMSFVWLLSKSAELKRAKLSSLSRMMVEKWKHPENAPYSIESRHEPSGILNVSSLLQSLKHMTPIVCTDLDNLMLLTSVEEKRNIRPIHRKSQRLSPGF